ncbi:hypothetical protein L1049_011597 [Liquidambar formosana]|uniref:Gag1-like clamp domain-containing protein n=1 Tax=Liquidambar formosana TaxID=63359 RepID=A0AAP0RYJ8_LIQFO
MQSSNSFTNIAAFQMAVSVNRTVKGLPNTNTGQQLLGHCEREWSFSSGMTEVNTGTFHSNEKQSLECSTSANEAKQPSENDVNTSVFVNHAAIAWHESRRQWVGVQSERSQRMLKDPIISSSTNTWKMTLKIFYCSWSTTYDELLSNNEPFPEPIPLPEMVDFLVDIWHDEGLYD